MNLDLSGKVVIVTGGASGIGNGIVETLLEEKATPIVLDLRPVPAKSKAPYYQTDLTNEDDIRIAIQEIIEQHSEIHGLVNNAGVNDGCGLNGTPTAFRRSLETNLVSAFTVTSSLIPHFSEGASIVNISSKVAVTGQGGTSGYAASKGGLLALTREWAVELAPKRIRSNAIIPAEVWTPQYKTWISGQTNPDEKKTRIEERIPLENRMTTIKEISDTTLFLLSPRSGHTTGQWIHVDGGYAHLDRAL